MNLSDNKIGDEGVYHLADGLQQNKVRLIFVSHIHLYRSTQTLITLNVAANRITDDGLVYLISTLAEHNRVRLGHYSPISYAFELLNTDTYSTECCTEHRENIES